MSQLVSVAVIIPPGHTERKGALFYRVASHGSGTVIAIHGGSGVDLESIYGDFAPLTEQHVESHGQRPACQARRCEPTARRRRQRSTSLSRLQPHRDRLVWRLGFASRAPGAAHFAYAERPDAAWPKVKRFFTALRRR